MPSIKKIQSVQKRFIEKHGGLCFFLIPTEPPTNPEMCGGYMSSPDCWFNKKRGLDQWLPSKKKS